jgi:hypothetical protein
MGVTDCARIAALLADTDDREPDCVSQAQHITMSKVTIRRRGNRVRDAHKPLSIDLCIEIFSNLTETQPLL